MSHVTQCAVCARSLRAAKVTVDGEVAGRFYSEVAKIISAGDASLTATTAFRIGGRSRSRLRTVKANNAVEYCRLVNDNCDAAACVILSTSSRSSVPTPSERVGLSISDPTDGSAVGPYKAVWGKADEEQSDGKTVWVIVKPDGDYFWVQRPAYVSDGRWRAEVRFGDPYTETGHVFQVCAVVDPHEPVRPGQRLREVPAATSISETIHVVLSREGPDQ